MATMICQTERQTGLRPQHQLITKTDQRECVCVLTSCESPEAYGRMGLGFSLWNVNRLS